MKTLTQEDRALIERWRDDLRTTTAKQGKHRLGDEESGYCCLGRLCVVTGEAFNPSFPIPFLFEQPVASKVFLLLRDDYLLDVAYQNDVQDMSFNEIADVLDIFLIDPDAFSGDESV